MSAEPVAPELSADGYAVQLIALPSEERLLEFVRDRNVSDLIATRITREGATHYVLLLGTYPNKPAAQAAATALPPALSDLSPWVRPLAGFNHF